MRVLVACERSGVVRDAFRSSGHDAWSCDLEPSHKPGPHVVGDIFEFLDGWDHALHPWDLMIAHPPCTHISNMSNCRINEPGRVELRKAGMDFFMRIASVGIPKIAIENPRGMPERLWRKADQIIHPYQFGHPVSKATCLWLKNLPALKPSNTVEPQRKWDGKRWRTWVDSFGTGNAWKRSTTFQGIADAMAQQWGGDVE